MRKSLSVLLAVAMVFSMFAGVALAEEQSALDRLGKAGIIIGGSDGNTMDDQNWKREDVATLLSRLYGVEDEVKDNPQTHTFADVDNPSYHGIISWVSSTDPVLMQGHNETRFGHGEFVTAQQFATVILRALEIDHEWEEAVEVAVENGIFAEAYDNGVELTRGQTWGPIVNALDTALPSGQSLGASLNLVGWEVEVADASAKVVGAKKIQVDFGQVVDPDSVGIVINKGSLTVNQKEVSFSDDKTSATIETATKVTEGDYVVVVSGVGADQLELKFSAENEKVTEITFTSQFAPIASVDNKTINVFYKVFNQYGEDISNTSLIATPGKGTIAGNTASGGKIEITSDSAFVLGERINVSLLHSDTSTFASLAVEVSPTASVANVEIVKFHEHNGNALTAGEQNPQNYYLVVKATDQYGNPVAAGDIAGQVVTTVSNQTLFSVAATYVPEDNETRLKLAPGVPSGEVNAGTATVSILPVITGNKSEISITVAEKRHVDTITLSAPEIAVAGEKVTIPFVAIDQFGDEITNADVLNGVNSISSSINVPNSLKFEQDYVNNSANLILNAESLTSSGSAYLTIATNTGKVAQLTVKIEDPAKPVVISGTTNYTATFAQDAYGWLGRSNIVVKDQYGRDFNTSGKLGTDPGEYQIKVETSAAGKVSLDGGSAARIINTNEGAVKLAAEDKGQSTITVTLLDHDGNEIDNSAYTYTARVVGNDEISDYDIEDPGILYDRVAGNDVAGHIKELKVNGYLANGDKVVVPASAYSVTSAVYTVDGDVFKLDGNKAQVGSDDNTRSVSLIVVIKADGTPLAKEITIAKAAPSIDATELRDSAGDAKKETDNLVSFGGTFADHTAVVSMVNSIVKATDQYGVEIAPGFGNGDVYVTNATDGKAIDELGQGDTFTVTAITDNAKIVNFKVILR